MGKVRVGEAPSLRLIRAGCAGAPGLKVRIRNRRKLLDESDDGPDFLIVRSDTAKARHAGHVDAVLHDPKYLSGLESVRKILEVGRIGPQSLGEFGPSRARRAVAADAAAR